MRKPPPLFVPPRPKIVWFLAVAVDASLTQASAVNVSAMASSVGVSGTVTLPDDPSKYVDESPSAVAPGSACDTVPPTVPWWALPDQSATPSGESAASSSRQYPF